MTEWRATVQIHSHDGEHMHVIVNTYGDSQDTAQKAAETITKVLTDGRVTAMRNAPESADIRDHDSREVSHRGYARFTFLDTPGETVQMPMAVERSSSIHYLPEKS